MSVVVPYTAKRESTGYGTPWEQIAAIVYGQMRGSGPLIAAMVDVRDRYNAEWVLPGFEEFGDLAPMVVADAIDNLGMLAAQVDPALHVPAIEPMKVRGRRSQEYASVRRKMIAATYRASAFDVGRGRAYRHFFGYATYSLLCAPDFENEHMRIQVADPLGTFAEPKDPEDLTPPRYYSRVYGKSASWLRDNYPDSRIERGGPVSKQAAFLSSDVIWDCVEWWDADCRVIGILGPRSDLQSSKSIDVLVRGGTELYRMPNRIGFTPAVCPTQVTLDRILSAVHRIIGSADLMAKFRALDLMGAEKAVIPDTYIIGSQPGTAPRLVAGRWIDGREGDVNYVYDANAVGQLRSTPDPSGKIAHDRIEGEAKRHVGLVPQMQGETYGALRTGRGIDALMGAASDPRAAEAHRLMSHALGTLNRAVLAGYKAYWGRRQFSMFSGWQGDAVVRFTPDEHVEVLEKAEVIDGEVVRAEKLALDNAVTYPIPGADVFNTTMALGQLRAMHALPLRVLRRMHPWIPDADLAEREQLVEDFELGMQAALLERFKMGIPPSDQAKIVAILRESGDIVAATELADRLASERQAAEPEPPPEGMALSPDNMPGLAGPGEGAETMTAPEPPPDVAGPTPSQANLRRLALALKTNARISA